MKKHTKRIKLLLVQFLISTSLFAQLTPKKMVEKMGRGINLGNVLNAPTEGDWSPPATLKYFQDVKKAGFKTVRIPMSFFGRTTGGTGKYSKEANTANQYNGKQTDYVVNEAYLKRIKEVVGWATAEGLVAIVDVHGYKLKEEFLYTYNSSKSEYTHPTSAKRRADLDKFKAIWKGIANNFKGFAIDNVVFEVINEPYFEVGQSDMNVINKAIISTIRATDGNNKTRKIIITGGGLKSYEAPTAIDTKIFKDDKYLIATFHYYNPFTFTYSMVDVNDKRTWGTVAEKDLVKKEFNAVLNWSKNNDNIAIFLGEYTTDNVDGYSYALGTFYKYRANASGLADGGPSAAARIEWNRYITEQAINRGFATTIWCGGPKSRKVLNLRQDHPDSKTYKISDWEPAQNKKSTVEEKGVWILPLKDAIIKAGKWPGSLTMKNRNFELGHNNNWSLGVFGNASATYSNAKGHSRNGQSGAKVVVTRTQAFDKVVLRNSTITQNLSGKTITVSAFAKASGTRQLIKLRLKTVVNGVTKYPISKAFLLRRTYVKNAFKFTYQAPAGTSSIEVQVVLGNNAGTYYFDDFNITTASNESNTSQKENQILSTANTKTNISDFNIFPNPVKNLLNIQLAVSTESIKQISIMDSNGRIINKYDISSLNKSNINVSNLKNGIYFIQVTKSDDRILKIKKIVITK